MTGRLLRLALGVGGGGALAVGSAVALALLSEVPYAAERGDHAVIRLAWRARGERVRSCRRLTPAELAKLPPHMRQEEVCERRILPYRLRVVIDGAPVIDELVRAGGAREDRPLFVLRDLVVAPGPHRLAVRFERQDGAGADRERDDRERPGTLEQAFTLAARQIIVVTYDDERRHLRLLAAPHGGS